MRKHFLSHSQSVRGPYMSVSQRNAVQEEKEIKGEEKNL